jgi:hypothetical protein
MTTGSGFTGFPGYLGPAGSGQDAVAGDGYGGVCVRMLADAALNVGQAVYISAADKVDAGASANLAATMGVVVGGKSTKGRCYPEAAMGAEAAAADGDWVLVCVLGKCRVVANAAVSVGAAIGFSAVAGKVDDVTTDATTVVGQRLGKALTAASSQNDEIDAWISPL